MFSGVYTALVTPFSKGKLDEAALKKLVELQVKGGVDGIVPVGTTGESPTVEFEEADELPDRFRVMKQRLRAVKCRGARRQRPQR